MRASVPLQAWRPRVVIGACDWGARRLPIEECWLLGFLKGKPMGNGRQYRMLRREIALVVAVSNASGCTTWRATAVAPEEFIADKHPAVVRVTRTDNTRVLLHRPAVSGDSLVGDRDETRKSGAREAMGVPLTQVQSVAVSRFDTGKTLVLAVGALLVAMVVVCADGHCGFYSGLGLGGR
jgi:hypothetical protein